MASMDYTKSRDARIIEVLDKALSFWAETTIGLHDASQAGVFPEDLKQDLLFGARVGKTFLGRKCCLQLDQAGRLLIEGASLERRVSPDTMSRLLRSAFERELQSARISGGFQTKRLLRQVRGELLSVKTADGTYAYPLVFAPLSKMSNFQIGPARILSIPAFQAEFGEAIASTSEELADAKSPRPLLREDWEAYSARFDHVLLVNIKGHDEARAWDTGREVAEYVLNLIRMRFGYRASKDIRLANGYTRDEREASLRVTPDGKVAFRTLRRWPGASFQNDWGTLFDQGIAPFQLLCASFASLLASGRDPTDPVLERTRFANQLISEAYSEPYDHIRVVRLISALEALSLVTGKDKAHNLAYRCASVGGWCDPGRATEIYDVVREAYAIRSAVVHGDGAPASTAHSSFLRLERHALEIFIGFLDLFAKLRAKKSFPSIRPLRKAVSDNIDWYFWDLV